MQIENIFECSSISYAMFCLFAIWSFKKIWCLLCCKRWAVDKFRFNLVHLQSMVIAIFIFLYMFVHLIHVSIRSWHEWCWFCCYTIWGVCNIFIKICTSFKNHHIYNCTRCPKKTLLSKVIRFSLRSAFLGHPV